VTGPSRLPSLSRLLPLVATLLVAAGCAAEQEQSVGCLPGEGEAELVIGKGLHEYQDIDDGGRSSELIHGPQGGFHIDLALQARHLDASDAWSATLVGSLDDEVMATARPYLWATCETEADALRAWGVRLIWNAVPEQLHDRLVDVDVEVIDAAGTALTARVEDLRIEDPWLSAR
jgi:hypothetical protein